MLTSRSSHLVRHLCRCRVRDFSAVTTVCAPRINRSGRSNDPPKPPSDINPAGWRRPTQLTYSDTSLTGSTVPGVPTVDLQQDPSPQPLPEGSVEAKDLYRTLVKSSPEEVLQLVEFQHEQLNKVHYALAMKRLFRFVRDLEGDEVEEFKTELQEQKGFQILLGLVALKGQYYEADVAADMLRFMCLFGLDSEHPALQVYLQLIKYHLNDLDLYVLVRLMHSLTSLTATSQTLVLQKAIKVLCNLRSNEVPSLNEWQLATLLEHCGDALDTSTLEKVLEQLLEETEGISSRLSAAIFRGLSKVDSAVLSEPPLVDLVVGIVTFCMDKLHGGISNMAACEIRSVMTSLSALGVYDADFYKDVGNHFVGTDSVSISDMLSVLGVFREQSYHHVHLVNSFKERLVDSLGGVSDLCLEQAVQTVHVLAEDSRPEEVLKPESRPTAERDMIQELCTRVLQGQCGLTKGEVEDSILDMAVLGATELSQQMMALSKQDQQTDISTQSSVTALSLTRLYQTDFIKSLKSIEAHERDTRDIGRGLHLALHQSQSPHVPDSHPLFTLIDYLVVNSEGTVQSEKCDQSDTTKLPQGLYPVAVKVLHDNCYHRNTGQLKGRQLLCGRLLQQQGHLVLFINCNDWRRMDERDMVPYLARRVKSIHQDQNLHIF